MVEGSTHQVRRNHQYVNDAVLHSSETRGFREEHVGQVRRMVLEVVPLSVGVVSRGWDEQAVDLTGAARLIESAGTAGFGPEVVAAADRFTRTWTRFATELSAECERHADALRRTVAGYVDSDEATFVDLWLLGRFVEEVA